MELLRQRQHGLGEERQLLDVDGELAGAGAEEIATDPDVVAEIEQLVERKSLLADGVEPDVNLQPFAALLQRGEPCLALRANGHNAAGDSDGGAISLELLGSRCVPALANLRNGMGEGELIGVGGLPQLLNLLKLRFAQLKQGALKLRVEHVVSFAGSVQKCKGQYSGSAFSYQLSAISCQLGLRRVQAIDVSRS